MNHILLIGAGFSRNWHGWLASEIAGDLAGRVVADPYLSGVLQRAGSFEDALSQIQMEYQSSPNADAKARLDKFQAALMATFASMNDAFARLLQLDFCNDLEFQILKFLAKFDAIFSLNQDLLLELHYWRQMEIPGYPRWSGSHFPGMAPQPDGTGSNDSLSMTWQPEATFTIAPNLQPIFKLHGSTNWRDRDGGHLLVMGADKSRTIRETAILRRYADEFLRFLSVENTRLMVIGYGFLDSHINDLIYQAWQTSRLLMFIVDPAGRNILRRINPTNTRPVYCPGPLEEIGILGDSTRSLSSTFGGSDRLEHGKLWRFFSS